MLGVAAGTQELGEFQVNCAFALRTAQQCHCRCIAAALPGHAVKALHAEGVEFIVQRHHPSLGHVDAGLAGHAMDDELPGTDVAAVVLRLQCLAAFHERLAPAVRRRVEEDAEIAELRLGEKRLVSQREVWVERECQGFLQPRALVVKTDLPPVMRQRANAARALLRVLDKAPEACLMALG
jgi:hypothetical protein